MARLLGLDIVGGWVHAVEANSFADPRQVPPQSWSGRLPVELSSENAKELASWLRKELASAGLRASDVVCSLGRNFVALKDLRIPLCPENEIPGIVAFAAEQEQGPAQEGVGTLLDYQVGKSDAEGCDVLAAVVARSLTDAVMTLAKAAGLNVLHLGLRPYSTHYLWRSLSDDVDGVCLLILPGEDGTELSVWSGDLLLLCRSVPAGEGEEFARRAAAEVRRTILSYQSQGTQDDLRKLVVLAPSGDLLPASLRDAIGRPVEVLELAPQHVPALGSIWRQLDGGTWPIDFANIKKPAATHDRRRLMTAVVAAFALLVPASAIGYGWSVLASQQARLRVHQEAIAKIEKDIKDLEPTVKRYRSTQQWIDGNVDWLREFELLATLFPDTSDAYLTNLNALGPPSGKLSMLEIQGVARGSEVVTQAQRKWANDPDKHYQVQVKGYGSKNSSRQFPIDFSLNLQMTPMKPADYVKRLADAKAPGAPEGLVRKDVEFEVGKAERPSPAPAAGNASAPRPTSSPSPSSVPKSSSSGSSSQEGDSGGDALSRMIARLKTLSYEEREKEIKAAPKFQQKAIRKRLQEASP